MERASPDQHHSGQKRRDAHDWATLIILTLTLFAAGAAAAFTGFQAWIARDQEHRALRAYLVVQPSLQGKFSDPDSLFAMIKSTNVGQTPVYSFMSFLSTNVIRFAEPLPSPAQMNTDCEFVYTHNSPGGAIFAKQKTEGIGVSSSASVEARAGLGDHMYGFYVYGVICYKDIFQATHFVRLCFHWYSDQDGADECPDNPTTSD